MSFLALDNIASVASIITGRAPHHLNSSYKFLKKFNIPRKSFAFLLIFSSLEGRKSAL
jgi:hypothetical protein